MTNTTQWILTLVVTLLIITGSAPSTLDPITTVHAEHDSDHVVIVGTQNGRVISINTQDQTINWNISVSSNRVRGLEMSNDGLSFVLVDDTGNTVQKRLTHDGSLEWSTTMATGDQTRDVAIGPDDEFVYVAGFDTSDGSVEAYHMSNGTTEWNNDGSFGDGLEAIAVSPDGDHVYVGGDENNVKKLSASDGSEIWTFSDPGDIVKAIAAGPGDEFVYVGDSDSVVWKVNESDGGRAGPHPDDFFRPDTDKMANGMSVSDNGDWLYFSDLDGAIYRLDTTDMSQDWKHSEPSSTNTYHDLQLSNDHVYAATRIGAAKVQQLNDNDGSVDWDNSSVVNEDMWGVASGVKITEYTVSGQVVDPNGIGVSGATVTTSTGETITTNADGNYSFEAVNGTYIVTADADGFKENETTVRVNGSDVTHDIILDTIQDLRLEVKGYMDHGSTQPYEVWEVHENASDVNVTANASVSSSDVSVVSVNSSAFLLEATGDVSVNERVVITAEYNNSTASRNVTVANLTVGNIKILPPEYRIAATIGDPDRVGGTQLTVLVLIIATLVAVVGKYGMSAFGGLSAGFLVLVIGFFGGWISLGLLLVALFLSVFLGLNLAANIDYQVRR